MAMFICGECGRECRPVKVEDGIGRYEYWGYRGIDRRYSYVSHCCEAEIFDEAGDPWDYYEVQEALQWSHWI